MCNRRTPRPEFTVQIGRISMSNAVTAIAIAEQIEHGESQSFLIIGGRGSGKTTLVRQLVKEMMHSEGRVLVITDHWNSSGAAYGCMDVCVHNSPTPKLLDSRMQDQRHLSKHLCVSQALLIVIIDCESSKEFTYSSTVHEMYKHMGKLKVLPIFTACTLREVPKFVTNYRPVICHTDYITQARSLSLPVARPV